MRQPQGPQNGSEKEKGVKQVKSHIPQGPSDIGVGVGGRGGGGKSRFCLGRLSAYRAVPVFNTHVRKSL